MRRAKTIKQQKEAVNLHRKGSPERVKAALAYKKVEEDWANRKRLTPRSER